MTKKRPRKLTRSQSQLRDLRNQSPIIMIEKSDEQELQMENPKPTEVVEEVDVSQIQSSKSIEEEGDDDVLQIENPNLVGEEVVEEEEEEPKSQSPERNDVDVDLQIENPKGNVVDVEEGLTCGNPKLIEEEEEEEKEDGDEVMVQIQNPSFELRQNRGPGLMEEKIQQLQIEEQDSESNFQKDCDMEHQDHQEQEKGHRDQEEEQEGISLSPRLPPLLPNNDELHLVDLVPENPSPTVTNISRKNPKRKKPLNSRQRAALEKKLQLTKENLRPIPFCPSETLDFTKHEKLFKRLGLWDFVHLEFDREIRRDLLCMLLANYNPSLRCSVVNDCRIMVNRADLARALKLPVKKDKLGNPSEGLDSDLLSEDSKQFLQDFVSNWILLHEDTWMMPSEVLTWTQFIKEGQPQKVDWPGLIWFMVDKELMLVPQLRYCYYASHLQCLMKSQREDLFMDEPRLEVESMEDGEECADLKTRSLDEFREQESEKLQTELCLGQDRNGNEPVQFRDEDVMDFQQCKEEENGGAAEWLLNGKDHVTALELRRCNLNKVDDLDAQHIIKEGEEEEDDEVRYELSSKFPPMEQLPSSDLLQAMDHPNISYSPPLQHQNQSSGQFLQARVGSQLNPGSSSMFGNACKRELNHDDDDDCHFNNDHKRLRHDGHWEQKPSDFYICMEEMNSWMSKARMMYEAKEQAFLNAQMNQQILYSEMQQRTNIMNNLHKTQTEEVHKRDLQIYKLERELLLMSNLLEGYRKALKDNRRQFAEYRERFALPEEPIYKDVGPGGVVLSDMELEKQRLQREEEEKQQCLVIEEKVIEFERGWLGKLEGFLNKVNLLGNRLSEIETKLVLLKDASVKATPKPTS